MADVLRLYLLGEFRLERAGQIIRLPGNKTKALLAYLALFPQKHPREKLAALFWGDSSDAAARKSLRVAFQPLYNEIGKDAFDGDSDGVQLAPSAGLWVDALAFSAGATRVSQNDGHESVEALVSLLREYRGEFLEGFYEDWIHGAREQFRTQYIGLALKLVERYRAASEYTVAAEIARKILEIDRAQEHAHQHLIFLYAAQGDRTAALAQFEACIHDLDEELGVPPSAETIALAKKIEQQEIGARSPASQLTNLPKPLTSFVGRERELKEIRDLITLRTPFSAALVTLTGAGGSGKTRLALECGRAVSDAFEHGVWWAELAPLSDGALVPNAVAKALGVAEQPNEPLAETLVHFLRQRELLLVLDNCEHLLDACARLTEQLLLSCEHVKILATSREGLNSAGEKMYPVAPLGVPRALGHALADTALEYSGVRLFVERARLADAQFSLTEANVLPILQICTRLDGIPLAIELAAARVKQMHVTELAARLDQRFELLVGTRTALPRQQTLRALIDWSFDLLTPAERGLFLQLSVFAGGWTLEAAEEICADEGLTRPQIPELLLQLVSKSLVQVNTTDDTARYFLLETVREYAREKTSVAGAAQRIHTHHLDYFRGLAEQAQTHVWDSTREAWMTRLDQEQDNLRAAFDFAMAASRTDEALRLAGALADYWRLRSRVREGTERLARALDAAHASTSPLYLAHALSGAGTMAWLRGDINDAERLHTQALEKFRAADDLRGAGYALSNLGIVLVFANKLEAAKSVLLEALALGQTLHEARLIELAYLSLGGVEFRSGNDARAENYSTQALVIARARQNLPIVATLLSDLACIARRRGDYTRALALFDESDWMAGQSGYRGIIHHNLLEKGRLFAAQGLLSQAAQSYRNVLTRAEESGNKTYLMRGLGGLSAVKHAEQDFLTAVRLFAFAETLGKGTGFRWEQDEEIEYAERKAALRETLGAAGYEAAWQTGEAMTPEQAVKLALQE